MAGMTGWGGRVRSDSGAPGTLPDREYLVAGRLSCRATSRGDCERGSIRGGGRGRVDLGATIPAALGPGADPA